jgi:hypothetical protein
MGMMKKKNKNKKMMIMIIIIIMVKHFACTIRRTCRVVATLYNVYLRNMVCFRYVIGN